MNLTIANEQDQWREATKDSQYVLDCHLGWINWFCLQKGSTGSQEHISLITIMFCNFCFNEFAFSALTLLVGWQEGHPASDLHTAQLMPLPLTVTCFSKIQTGVAFLVPAYLGSPRKMAVKRVCVCEFAFTVQVKHKINSTQIQGFILICLYFMPCHFHTCTL